MIPYKLNDSVPFKTSSMEGVRYQSGGGQQQHTLSTTASYGYTGSNGFKTSHYAPITKNVTAHNQCGGKRKKKRKSRKKSRKKSKSRNKSKWRRRRYKHKGGANCKCCKCCNKKKSRKNKTKSRKKKK